MGDTLTPEEILSLARYKVLERAPYFRAGLMQLVPRAMPGMKTFATTKNWILMWDPEKALEYGVEGTAAVLMHELWHLVRDHFGRFSKPLTNQDLANIAGDLSINPGVVKMGFRLPGKALFPEKFDLPNDLTAEEYYEKLLKMDVQYVYFDANSNCDLREGMIEVEGCGSCSGRPVPREPEVNDYEGRSDGEIRRTRITIAKAIKQYHRGNLPHDLSRWADQVLEPPKVRWEEKLRRACRAIAAYRPGSGYNTYAKVSRRQAGIGFGPGLPVLPSVRGMKPRVTFLIDTSGSMRSKQLARMMSEAQDIFRVCGATLDVIVCDAAVHGVKQVRSMNEACAMLKGGGGSDFRPAFAEILKSRQRPEIVIAATDGDIAVPTEEPPGLKVIWLLVGRQCIKPCAWGAFVEVDD